MNRSLTEKEVIALRDLADKGPMHCDCEGNPEKCHCSTIIMLCNEWIDQRTTINLLEGDLRDDR